MNPDYSRYLKITQKVSFWNFASKVQNSGHLKCENSFNYQFWKVEKYISFVFDTIKQEFQFDQILLPIVGSAEKRSFSLQLFSPHSTDLILGFFEYFDSIFLPFPFFFFLF